MSLFDIHRVKRTQLWPIYKSHLSNQKKLSEAQVHIYLLLRGNFYSLLIVFKLRLLVAHKYMYILLLMDHLFNLQLQAGDITRERNKLIT